ncbi:MAG: hypothetical protein JOZ16_12695 [Methylobacteriaceae bacterium]|nr:hypothetical protein [Methylobacteriaceae bacterium]
MRLFVFALMFALATSAQAEKSTLAITRQPSMIYMPAYIMEGVMLFSTQRFVDANPALVYTELANIPNAHVVLRMSKDPTDELVELVKPPKSVYVTRPQGTMQLAGHMFKTGLLKQRPASWKDYMFPVAQEEVGS